MSLAFGVVAHRPPGMPRREHQPDLLAAMKNWTQPLRRDLDGSTTNHAEMAESCLVSSDTHEELDSPSDKRPQRLTARLSDISAPRSPQEPPHMEGTVAPSPPGMARPMRGVQSVATAREPKGSVPSNLRYIP